MFFIVNSTRDKNAFGLETIAPKPYNHDCVINFQKNFKMNLIKKPNC